MLFSTWRCRIFVLLLSVGCISITGCSQKKRPKLYDMVRETTVTGTVVDQVGLMQDEDLSICLLRLRTDDKKQYIIKLAPSWYMKQQDFKVLTGNKITVIGAPKKKKGQAPASNNRRVITLLAHSLINVSRGNTSVVLSDKDGNPMWEDID